MRTKAELSGDSRTARLNTLMESHALSVIDVTLLIRRSTKTVYMWKAGVPRPIPGNMLRLLEYELGERARRKPPARDAR